MNILSVPQCKLPNLIRDWQMPRGKLEERDYIHVEICMKQENTNVLGGAFDGGVRGKDIKTLRCWGQVPMCCFPKVSFLLFVRR